MLKLWIISHESGKNLRPRETAHAQTTNKPVPLDAVPERRT